MRVVIDPSKVSGWMHVEDIERNYPGHRSSVHFQACILTIDGKALPTIVGHKQLDESGFVTQMKNGETVSRCARRHGYRMSDVVAFVIYRCGWERILGELFQYDDIHVTSEWFVEVTDKPVDGLRMGFASVSFRNSRVVISISKEEQ